MTAALRVSLPTQGIISNDKPLGGSVEAYRLMFQARTLIRRDTEAGARQSIALLEQALQLDQRYAYGYAALSNAWMKLGQRLKGLARQQAFAQARALLVKAQALAPDAAVTHVVRGDLLTQVDVNPIAALPEYRRALELAPNDSVTMTSLVLVLQNVGQIKSSVAMFNQAIALDPMNVDSYNKLVNSLIALDQFDTTEHIVREALILQPNYHDLYAQFALVDILRHNSAAALRDAGKETRPGLRTWVLVLAKQIGPDRKEVNAALRDYVAKDGKFQPYLVANMYALRGEANATLEWLERAKAQHDPHIVLILFSDSFMFPYRHDPRFAPLCKQVGLPVPTDMPSNLAASALR